jgi:hypothetical protein
MNEFEIETTEEPGMLRFTLKGPATHANFLRAVAAITEETKSRDLWHVICDVTAVIFPLGAFEKFEAGVELARTADWRMKMAVIAQVEGIDYVFENVARSRGVSAAVFGNEAAALHWLLSTVPE